MIETRKLPGCAIVTGGARGLGEAMVLELASEGYDVVINYVTDKSAGKQTILAMIRGRFPEASSSGHP